MGIVNNRLREVRRQLGLSQESVANQAGISRQAYIAIESSRSVPSTEVSLKLGRILKETVESLFSLGKTGNDTVMASFVGGVAYKKGMGVQVMQVGERLLARAIQGPTSTTHVLTHIDGTLESSNTENRVQIHMSQTICQRMETVVMAGCDPAVSYLANALQEHNVRLVWYEMGSMDSLQALARGETHVAGCHVQDPQSLQFNTPWVKKLIPFQCTVVRFAIWRQGLMVQLNNPLSLSSVEDVANSKARIVNRQSGSGSRLLLDRLLATSKVTPKDISGYAHVAGGHLAMAEAISSGLADTGVGAEVAARVTGLDFVPLGEESYDLVIPNRFLNNPSISKLLDILRSASLRTQVERLGGYDASLMGNPV